MLEIVFKNINYSYKLENFISIDELKLSSEKILNIVGNNGSGKTTLAKIIAGLFNSNNLKVYVNNEKKEINDINVSMIFQNPNYQFIKNTVIEDIAFGLENKNISKDDMDLIIKDISKQFEIEDMLYEKIETLSGGQKQVIALISNLVLKPDVLILDEAFEMIDVESNKRIIRILKDYQKINDICIVNINHNSDIIDEFDDVLVLSDGEKIAELSTYDFFKNKKLLQAVEITPPFKYEILEELKCDLKEVERLIWK